MNNLNTIDRVINGSILTAFLERLAEKKSEMNWPMFFYQFDKDHAKPKLICNSKVREELREALERKNKVIGVRAGV